MAGLDVVKINKCQRFGDSNLKIKMRKADRDTMIFDVHVKSVIVVTVKQSATVQQTVKI